VRSGPGAARTILLVHIISASPSKQPLMVRSFLKVYMELGSYLFSARTNKRHHHQRAGGGKHAVGVCDDGADTRGGDDEKGFTV
jgi:hypothetical protein